MNGQEFATAVQYDIPVIMVVLDNSMYGTIRMHQERHYPRRVSATRLKNPDFAALARDFWRIRRARRAHGGFCAGLRGARSVRASPRSCTVLWIRKP